MQAVSGAPARPGAWRKIWRACCAPALAFDDWLLRFGQRPRVLAWVAVFGLITGPLAILAWLGIQPQRDADRLVEQAVARAERDAARIAGLEEQLAAKDRIIVELAAAFGALGRAGETGALDPAEVERALEAAARGDREAARAALRQLAERATEAAETTDASAREMAREAAERWRQLGAVASVDDTRKALEAYRRAVELDPEDVWNRIELARLERRAGDLAAAGRAAQRALELARKADSAGDVATARTEIGDVRRARGDLEGAAEEYGASLKIRQKLAAADPTNAQLERDLSVSWERIGDVRRAWGDLEGAQEAYEAALEIRRKFAAADRRNAQLERDLSVSWERIGDLRMAGRDLAGAAEAYEQALAIAERLAAEDLTNAGWQRDLSVSRIKICNLRVAQGDLAGAEQACRKALAIAERLAAEDSTNAEWQRDLISSNVKLAELAERRGRHDVAARRYAKALAIARELAATGRLAPADAWMPADLERRFAAAQEAAAKEGGAGD